MILVGNYKIRFACLGLLFFFSPFLQSCKKEVPLINLQGQALGGKFTIKYFAANPEISELQVARYLKSFFTDIQDKTSLYQNDSELIRINNSEEKKWISVSKEIGEMLNYAVELSSKTNGYYDVTSGSISKLWSSDDISKISFRSPQQESIAKTIQHSGYKNLLIKKEPDGYFINKKIPGIMIDLASLSAGYCADQISHYFQERQINNYLIDIGGEFRASGKNKKKPWVVGIENPLNEKKPVINVPLNNLSMATSGTYRHFIKENNKDYSHIMDPHTGRPVQGALISLSVLKEKCMYADALATALFAMGEDRAWKFSLENHIPVFMIFKEGENKIKTKMTPNFFVGND